MHTHTGERLTAAYFDAGAYCEPVLAQVNQLLRDFRTETVFPIDRGVLDRLFAVQAMTGSHEPFEVISGYRSPATNAALRRASHGVAEHSLHMQGRAIDVRLSGFATERLALLARAAAGRWHRLLPRLGLRAPGYRRGAHLGRPDRYLAVACPRRAIRTLRQR